MIGRLVWLLWFKHRPVKRPRTTTSITNGIHYFQRYTKG